MNTKENMQDRPVVVTKEMIDAGLVLLDQYQAGLSDDGRFLTDVFAIMQMAGRASAKFKQVD